MDDYDRTVLDKTDGQFSDFLAISESVFGIGLTVSDESFLEICKILTRIMKMN